MEWEDEIARIKNVEACVVLQSGFTANAGTVSAVLGKEDVIIFDFFFSSRRRHTRFKCDWSSDVCSSDLLPLSQRLSPTHLTTSPLAGRKSSPLPSRCHLRGRCLPGTDYRCSPSVGGTQWRRSEERRVGEECRSRWSPYH